ncbi:MAG: hypothetical protein HRS57_01355 [Mycoplasmataceae bacterium]|nr:hypothetical protein [Mycoplasmataceae bacterium]
MSFYEKSNDLDRDTKTSFFDFKDRKNLPYNFTTRIGIILFYIIALSIIAASLSTTILYSSNHKFFEFVVYSDLSFEYIINSLAVWASFSVLIIYLFIFLVSIHWIYNINSEMYSLKQYKRRAITIGIFFLIIPGVLIYKGKYITSDNSISEDETDFLKDTKYSYSVDSLRFINNLKDTSIIFGFLYKISPPIIKRTFFSISILTMCLVSLIVTPVFFSQDGNISNGNGSSSYSSLLIGDNYIDEIDNSRNGTSYLELNSNNFNISPDEILKFESYIIMSPDGFVKFEINDLNYVYDVDGDGMKMVETDSGWVNGTSDDDRWYVNKNGIPVSKDNPEAAMVEEDLTNNSSNASMVPISWISNTINPYSKEYYFVLDIGYGEEAKNGNYQYSFVINESPYEKIIKDDNPNYNKPIYYQVSLVDNSTNQKYYFTSGRHNNGDNKLVYNKEDSYTYLVDWNNSIVIDEKNKNVKVSPKFYDNPALDPYINNVGTKEICYKPFIDFDEYIEANEYSYYDFTSSISSFPTLESTTNISSSNCPDFYIPIDTEFTLDFENINAYSNALKNDRAGFLQIGINIAIVEDYNKQVINANFSSNEVVSYNDAKLGLNNKLPIAGVNNTCEYYYSYDESTGSDIYYQLDKTSASTYQDPLNSEKIDLYNSTSNSISTNSQKTCLNYFGDSLSSFKNSSGFSPVYNGRGRSINYIPAYDFDEDGDYTWFSDDVKTISLHDSATSTIALPVNGAPAQNIYNDSTSTIYGILFLEIFPFALLFMFFAVYLFDRKYLEAINITRNARISTRSILDQDEMKFAFEKWMKGEEIMYDDLKKQMFEEKGIDTKLDF